MLVLDFAKYLLIKSVRDGIYENNNTQFQTQSSIYLYVFGIYVWDVCKMFKLFQRDASGSRIFYINRG